MSEPVHAGGLFASVRRLLATALEMAQVRLSLLSTEVELEKRRLFDALLWAILAMLMLGVGLVLLCGFVIMLLADAYRLPALGVMALVFLIAGLLLVRQARRGLHSPAGMFGISVAELERDRTALQSTDQHDTR